MSETNERKPQVGEYWKIKPECGIPARFGKILKPAPSSRPNAERYMVNCIEEGECYSMGFTFQLCIMRIDDFEGPTCPSGREKYMQESLQIEYREAALALFKKKLEEKLAEI